MVGTTTVVSPVVLEEPMQNGKLIFAGEKHEIDWTSDASGNVSGTNITLRGFLVKALTIPSGVAAPTDNYDITLLDPDSVAASGTFDSLHSALIDRDTANTEEVYFTGATSPPYLNGAYAFVVANAGNAKSGKLFLYMVNR